MKSWKVKNLLEWIKQVLACFLTWVEKIQVFHLETNLRSSSIYKHILGCLSFAKQLRLSSIYKTIEVVFHWTKIEVIFHLQNKLRSSSI
jgi:hypothetical protein